MIPFVVSSYEENHFQQGCTFWWICYTEKKNFKKEDKFNNTSQQVKFENVEVGPANIDEVNNNSLSSANEENVMT